MSGAGPDLLDPAVSTTADPALDSTDYTIPVIVGAIAGFLLLTCSMAVCYAKRWLCFAVSAVQLAVRLGNPECSFTLFLLAVPRRLPRGPDGDVRAADRGGLQERRQQRAAAVRPAARWTEEDTAGAVLVTSHCFISIEAQYFFSQILSINKNTKTRITVS